MKQIKLTAVGIFAATMFLVSCGGGKKSAKDLAKSHCELLKKAAAGDTEAAKKGDEEMKKAMEGLKGEDSTKFVTEYMEELKNCGVEEKK